MPDSPDVLDFYDRPTAYDLLGVAIDASAKDIRDKYGGLQRDLQETVAAAADRAREKGPSTEIRVREVVADLWVCRRGGAVEVLRRGKLNC